MNAKVVLCKCPQTKGLYGVRIEERNNDWLRTWAFKISEKKAKNEKYENSKISGSLHSISEYPGCPYCSGMGIAQCSCGKLFCWRSEVNSAVCPWCEQKSDYRTVNSIEFDGSGL